jgi:Arc/MetJ-type ribon-helix-helix transcriptional regulator
MVTATQIGIRLTDEDLAIIASLQERTGIGNRTDVIRLALRRLADAEGVQLAHKPKPKRR